MDSLEPVPTRASLHPLGWDCALDADATAFAPAGAAGAGTPPPLQECSAVAEPQPADSVSRRQTPGSRLCRVSIKGLTANTSLALLGRGFAHVSALEERLKCSLQPDLERRVLTAWVHPDDAAGIEAELTRMMREVREGALEQVREEPLQGGTRALFGCGAVVQSLLCGAHVTVQVNGLPRGWRDVALREIAETWGRVRSCEVKARTSGRSARVWGRVVYYDAKDAARAVTGLQGERVGDPPAVLAAFDPGGRMPDMLLADKSTGTPETRNPHSEI